VVRRRGNGCDGGLTSRELIHFSVQQMALDVGGYPVVSRGLGVAVPESEEAEDQAGSDQSASDLEKDDEGCLLDRPL
jgi:hypothetical protein